MEKNLIKGGIYSKFHGKLGPRAIVWHPSDVSEEIRNTVSLKTINILSGEKGETPKSLAVIPFPSNNIKGLVKAIEIKDETRRGGVVDASITILFDEANDLIFYKYMSNFETVFNETSNKVIELEESNADKDRILAEMKEFYSKLNTILNELRETEISTREEDAFPEVIPEKVAVGKSFRFKIIVCGDPGVGKTSTVLRFTDRAFKRTYIPTIGVNISEKKVNLTEAISIIYILWDIAGQSKFSRMRKHFYQGADGVLLVFDLTRPNTLNSIPDWYKDVKSYLKRDMRGFIVGNKNDLIGNRKIKGSDALKIAEKLKLEYIETSALTGENIDDAFYKLGELLKKI
ncbi:MAG: GTP-binding protein [Candidatus Helarchaeota archaeon]|nr:GTP-binding protein [Candidatus Helarchaeota archaeon]